MIKVFDKKLLFSICGIILIFLLIFTIYRENQVMYTNGSELSNKKIGWGIKREKDHKRPDVGKENKELMEKYNGIYIDKEELIEYGRNLKLEIEEKTQKIYKLCGQEFNINSTKQLGKILFEDLKLPVQKKKKSGYSTDVEVLEKLRGEHPVIDEILDYRQLMKLNSTYVEGMLPYINRKTNRIHSFFHQTVTATRKNK